VKHDVDTVSGAGTLGPRAVALCSASLR